MKFPSFALAATALAVAVSTAGTAAVAAIPAAPSFSFLPPHTGQSQSYRYEVDEAGPRGTTKIRQSMTFAREANDRMKITITSDDGSQPTTLYAIVGPDGALTAAPAQTIARAPFPTQVNPPAPGAPQTGPTTDSNLPMDRPILGLPGGSGGNSSGRQSRGGYPGGGYPGGTYPGGGQPAGQTFARPAQPTIPRNVQVVVALTAAARLPQQTAGTFVFSAGVGEPPHVFRNYDPAQTTAPPTPAPASAVPMTAKLSTAKTGETQIVADGTGSVLVSAAGPSDTPRTGGQRSGGGQRGGGSGRGGGGQGGGIGSILFPGGGSAGGGGRGQDGGQRAPSNGASTAGSNTGTIPATMNVHLESTFRNGVLQVARGKTVATYTQNGASATTTSTWLLSAY